MLQNPGKLNFKLAKTTNKKVHPYTNRVYLNPQDMERLGLKKDHPVLIESMLVHQAREDEKTRIGEIGTSGLQWSALHLKQAVGKTVTLENWKCSKSNLNTKASAIVIVVDTYSKALCEVKVEHLEEYLKNKMISQTFCPNQNWIIKWRTEEGQIFYLKLVIGSVYRRLNDDNETKEDAPNLKNSGPRGQVECSFGQIDIDNTIITLMAAANPFIKLIQPKGAVSLSRLNWDPEAMGIGGLDDQFGTIFRRAFASRLYPPDIVKKLGVKHVKGMLLHGPPGTGKTLIARSIGKLLTDKEPKVVNGPEILNKFVGQSEENIRNLFKEAVEDQKKNGDNAGLHIIIFDEIDAICKQRGSTGSGGTGVHDTVVNQILSMIDGVNALNNVLVIGMTNRKDLLDDALLRSGRLEVHIEIGLPNEQGRIQIFRIHTKQLRENGFLDKEVSIEDMAKETKNYTGAEIEAVVRSAISYAMQKYIDVDKVSTIDPKKCGNLRVTKEYFDMALKEVKPELGQKNNDTVAFSFSRGIFKYNDDVSELIKLTNTIVKRMKRSNLMNRQAILLEGEIGSGKTAMAGYLAMQTEFPFLRVINADNFIGESDISICMAISKVFNDAYKSPLSCVIIDDIERIIGYTSGGGVIRFSNPILQALLTCIRKTPNESRKILIIATTTSSIVKKLQINKVFDFKRDMPKVYTKKEFSIVLNESKNNELCEPNLSDIVSIFPETKNGVGINSLLTVLELSINENNVITKKSFTDAWKSKFTDNNVDDDQDLY